MAAIDQHEKLHLTGSPVKEERVHGGAYGTAGEEYIVHQDDFLIANREADFRLLHHGFGTERGEVVAVERNVERADGNWSLLPLPNDLCQPLRNRDSPAANSHQA